MSQFRQRSAKINEAIARLLELDDEATEKQASCKIAIEVTYSKGIPQHVKDERRRYERGK